MKKQPVIPKSELPEPNSESILLAVIGMSPAILTETIWALAHPTDDSEPVIPSRVMVVTTSQVREQVSQLFQPAPQLGGLSPWDALRAALQKSGHHLEDRLRFGTTADDVRVITAGDSATGRTTELADIRTAAHNAAAADFLLEQVRSIVENPDTQLIVSIAGGRKTMGALLYACMTLVGRETDRLTHVLVNEPFDTLRGFWFPAQPGGPIPSPALRPLPSTLPGDPASALVELADVPFVPLRNLFIRELGRKAGTFSRLVETCRDHVRQRAAEGLRVSLDPARAELDVNGAALKLAPMEMLLLLFLARRAKQGVSAYAQYKDAVDDLNAFRTGQLGLKKDFSDLCHADSLRSPWTDREITKAVADLRAKLRGRGGELATLANCLPAKGRCSLDLPGALIFIK